jgi:hypothetical protein
MKTITKFIYAASAVFAIVCFALSPTAQAVTPAPDGGYPNENTAEGDDALFSLTSGAANTAVGSNALYFNTTGDDNVANGYSALRSNTTGYYNTATGAYALQNNTSSQNTANGYSALRSNTTGNHNTATGVDALFSNTTGASDTATGAFALFRNTIGEQNTASGGGALQENTTGNNDTASGFQALSNNTTGNNNTASGFQALGRNTTGNANTANGVRALFYNTTGFQNTATGAGALFINTTGNGNVAEGVGALQNNTGSFNTALGFNAGANLTTGSNNIDIGVLGVAGESNTIRIGTVRQTATFIGGIRGVTTGMANAIPVLIDSSGQLGTASSSRRFKKEIKPIDKASEAILALRPVTFHYKSDNTGTPQFGLIAEEVAEVNPQLVVRDENGEIYTVRYEAVNAMLLNEFLKAHCKMEEQEATISQLKSTVAKQQKDFQATATHQQEQIEALTAGLQKVSDKVELDKPAPQTVLNDQ